MKNYYIEYAIQSKLSNGILNSLNTAISVNAYNEKKAVEKLKSKIKKAYGNFFVGVDILKIDVIGYY